MKHYHIFFIILKLVLLIQFSLILFNKQTVNSKVYILTKIIFKASLGVFIDLFMFHNTVDHFAIEDKIIISFAGGLLVFDAFANDLPELLNQFNIHLPYLNPVTTKNIINT